MFKLKLLPIYILLGFVFCVKAQNGPAEWITLFDGTTLEGWRAYNGGQMPPGWKIIDSVLTFNTEQIFMCEWISYFSCKYFTASN